MARDGEKPFIFHGVFHIDAGKNYSTRKPRSFELFLLFFYFVPVDLSFIAGKIQISTNSVKKMIFCSNNGK